MSAQRIALIQERLQTAFAPQQLDIRDDSHLHAGHAGARSGRGHFSVTIVADAFTGQSLLARHRAVYAALSTLMDSDIHALAISARTPEEAGTG